MLTTYSVSDNFEIHECGKLGLLTTCKYVETCTVFEYRIFLSLICVGCLMNTNKKKLDKLFTCNIKQYIAHQSGWLNANVNNIVMFQ